MYTKIQLANWGSNENYSNTYKLDATVSPEVTRILPAFAVTPSYLLVTSDLIYNVDMSHMIVLRCMGVKLSYMHEYYGQVI